MKTPNRSIASLVVLVTGLLSVSAAAARADITMPAIFSDHMVLQRETAVPVWGWAGPGENITVTIAGQTQTTRAAADGKWMVTLTNLTGANGQKPATLTITGENTKQPVIIKDVLIGEVWLGSGQSNMALVISRGAINPDKEIAAANHPLIRLFQEGSVGSPAPQRIGQGKWAACSPDTIGDFSAMFYFFGREIHQALNVPVGLVESDRGGTKIQAWIDGDAQRKTPALKGSFESIAAEYAKAAQANPGADVSLRTKEERAAQQAAPKGAKGAKGKKGATKSGPDAADVSTLRSAGPGGLFNGKIAPLIPFAVRGILWYQGEANTKPDEGRYYAEQLKLLVTDWRARWGRPDMPFAWAQLPLYNAPGRNWPLVREGELKTLALPNTGMTINIDTGETDNIHPRNKIEVGRRFAQWALGAVYGKPVPATSGPLPAGSETRGNEIVVRFTHADGGLVAKAKDGALALKGFVIAGADKKWRPAQARIEGDTVVISSPSVPSPVAVRYAWENAPEATLFNAAGLPVSPFRTDDWDGKIGDN